MSKGIPSLRSFTLGVLLVAGAGGSAQALSVSRCNSLSDGVYRPVLVVVNDGVRTEHAIGQDGLTRGIAFSPSAALAWAAAFYGADIGTVEYDASCAASAQSDPAPPPVVDEDDDDEGCGSEGDGCGSVGEGNDSQVGGFDDSILYFA